MGTWGKPVLRLAGLSAGRKSGARAGGFYATGEHISEVESQPARSGVSEVWLRLPAAFKDAVVFLSFGQRNGTSIACRSKITIMAKLKTSKKESERIKKVTDDFKKKCYALHEEEIRQSIIKIGRKLPVPGAAIALEKVRAKCLPELKRLGKKYSEEFLATKAGLNEAAIDYLVFRFGDKNLEIYGKTALAYRYKILGKIARKYPVLRAQATLMQNRVVTDLAGTDRKDG